MEKITYADGGLSGAFSSGCVEVSTYVPVHAADSIYLRMSSVFPFAIAATSRSSLGLCGCTLRLCKLPIAITGGVLWGSKRSLVFDAQRISNFSLEFLNGGALARNQLDVGPMLTYPSMAELNIQSITRFPKVSFRSYVTSSY